MLPVHTRGVQVRSVSPPPRRALSPQVHTSSDRGSESDAGEPIAERAADSTVEDLSSEDECEGDEESGPAARASTDRAADDEKDIMSVRAAVKEYERVHDDIRSSNLRTKKLRERAACLRQSLQDFMSSRNLERLGTRDGRLTVRLSKETMRVRPSKRDTMRCVADTLGETNADLAEELIRKLYEEKKATRTVTRLLKHDTSGRRA